ncbi:MAG: LysM peptidoglycan-binding domain-containing protein [Bauldia sp.]|nr:LysM peptidoglycan-binding domain-containing protein [Bauldia sp.]
MRRGGPLVPMLVLAAALVAAVAFVVLRNGSPDVASGGAADALGLAEVPADAVAAASAGDRPAPVVVAQAEPDGASDAGAPFDYVAPLYDIVRVGVDGAVILAGQGTPGARIELIDAFDVIGVAEVNGRGEWVLLPDGALSPGTHDLALRTTSADGRYQVVADERIGVLVEAGSPALVVLAGPDAPSRVLQQPRAQDAVRGDPAVVTIGTVEADGAALYVGGEGRGLIRVYLDETMIAEAVADAGGQWTILAEAPDGPGPHVIRADRLEPGSATVVARAEVTFGQSPALVAAMDDAPPDVMTLAIRRGDNLWELARRLYGDGLRYTTIYDANRDQIRDPGLIYPGQVLVIPAPD